jgi:hypothetical protein
MSQEFFPLRPEANPKIYVYSIDAPNRQGLLKVGYTVRDAATRIAEQVQTSGVSYQIEYVQDAMRNDGSSFTDRDIHRYLRTKGFQNPDGEWFRCSLKDIRSAIIAVTDGQKNEENRTLTFPMRPEQQAAIEKTKDYFTSFNTDKNDQEQVPQFLWNCKMRFGKTFTAYKLAKSMDWQRVLVLTFKPAVHNAWEEDLMNHVDFKGWQFISNQPDTLNYEDADTNKPFVCFGSFQDFLGKNSSTGGIKTRNEWVHAINWDCVVFDEYHFGAWNENSKGLFSELYEDGKDEDLEYIDKIEKFDAEIIPISTDHFLYLSGTPFRAISSGEFIEEAIFNWTYSDEQKAKAEWSGVDNPYASLPRMVMLTYQLPDAITEIAKGGEFNEFDLNVFFKADGQGDNAKFNYESEVQKWLDLIRGSYLETTVDNLKLGTAKPPMPFSDARLLSVLTHTFWFLPSISSCYAMRNLMQSRNNTFYHDYNIVVAAGTRAGIGVNALPPVLDAMNPPLNSKSITLSCGKLTTGVSVKPWTGILMLRNSSSPETYFQAAFRVQTPWTIKNPDGLSPNKEEIIKEECYVFDFAPTRALRQISEYSTQLNVEEPNPEKCVAEFIHFLPVLAYDGSSMKQIDAAGILDMAMSGTTATLLARRWESALLVNVDNHTLKRLLDNEQALKALMAIEGFRSLNQEIETIINKSEAVKKTKKEANEKELSSKEKKELSSEEKEYKSIRKQIQDKLIKFATRVPVFMYLTDYRERSLKDVITQLEPGLFKKVTGLNVGDFELLVSLGLFNSALMNDAVFKFKRYEDTSLSYTGINKHEGEEVGGYDTVMSPTDYKASFVNES